MNKQTDIESNLYGANLVFVFIYFDGNFAFPAIFSFLVGLTLLSVFASRLFWVYLNLCVYALSIRHIIKCHVKIMDCM